MPIGSSMVRLAAATHTASSAARAVPTQLLQEAVLGGKVALVAVRTLMFATALQTTFIAHKYSV